MCGMTRSDRLGPKDDPSACNPLIHFRAEETAVTQQEIEAELKSLREQEQARRKRWRGISRTAAFCAIVFVLGGTGFLVFSVAYPGTRHDTLSAAVTFLMLSMPMTLLSSALR